MVKKSWIAEENREGFEMMKGKRETSDAINKKRGLMEEFGDTSLGYWSFPINIVNTFQS